MTSENVYVLNEGKEKESVSLELTDDKRKVVINPPVDKYIEGTYYEIHFTDQLNYEDGDKVESPYRMDFKTEGQEVEEVVKNPEIEEISIEKVEFIEESKIEISKKDIEEIKEGNIIVITSDEFKEGTAVKVLELEENRNSYEMEIGTPEFFELFEEINISKSYELTEEHIKLSEGVEMASINQLGTNELIASSNSEEKYEYKLPKISMDTTKKGIEFELKNIDVDGKKGNMFLAGSLKLLKPVIDLDVKTKLFSIEKVEMISNTDVELDLELSNTVKGGTKVYDFKDKLEEENPNYIKGKYEKRIGEFELPINGGLKIYGDIILEIVTNYKGEAVLSLNIQQSNKMGVVYKNEKAKLINKNEVGTSVQIEGNIKIDSEIGPAFNFGLKAFEVVGVGLEFWMGGGVGAEAALGKNFDFEEILSCGLLETSFKFKGSAVIDLIAFDKKYNVGEWKFAKVTFGEDEFELGKCKIPSSVEANINELLLENGEQQRVIIKEKYFDVLKAKYNTRKVGLKDLSYNSKDEAVANVSGDKDDKSIVITANDLPTKEKTEIEVVVKEGKLKGQKMLIPLTITNFKEVQEDAAKEAEERALKEAEEATKKEEELAQESQGWVGEWHRNEYANAPGVLEITEVGDGTLRLNLNAMYDMNVGVSAGIAYIQGDIAVQEEDEFGGNCPVILKKRSDGIEVSLNSDDCLLGLNVSLDGIYKRKE